MCGDFDDFDQVDGVLFERFIAMAGQHGVTPTAGPDTSVQLDEEESRAEYMQTLFRAGLSRSLNDAASLPHGEHMDALAGQAIVFARLAGFLAGQFPPESDLFRTITSAVMDGHRESSGANHQHSSHHH